MDDFNRAFKFVLGGFCAILLVVFVLTLLSGIISHCR